MNFLDIFFTGITGPIVLLYNIIYWGYLRPVQASFNYCKKRYVQYKLKKYQEYVKRNVILELRMEKKLKEFEKTCSENDNCEKWFQMRNEIISAANLIVYVFEIGLEIPDMHMVRTRTKLTKEKIEEFRYHLIMNMFHQFSTIWFPEQPEKCASSRFLRLNRGFNMHSTHDVNTPVKKAMKQLKISNYIQKYVFPPKFFVFVHPGQVFFCIMKYDKFYYAYNSKPIKSKNDPIQRSPFEPKLCSLYKYHDFERLCQLPV